MYHHTVLYCTVAQLGSGEKHRDVSMVMTMRVVVMGMGVGVGAHFARILLELLARRVELDAHTIGGLRQA